MANTVNSGGSAMNLGVTIDRGNYRKFSNDIRRVIKDMTDFWENDADKAVREWFKEVFATKGAVYGSPWAPRRPATLSIYKRQGITPVGGVGMLTGAMRTAFTRKGAKNATVTVTKTSYERVVTLTSKDGEPYPIYFNVGWPSKKMFGKPKSVYDVPARPLVVNPMPAAFNQRLEAAAQKWIAKQLSPYKP